MVSVRVKGWPYDRCRSGAAGNALDGAGSDNDLLGAHENRGDGGSAGERHRIETAVDDQAGTLLCGRERPTGLSGGYYYLLHVPVRIAGNK